MSKTTKPKPSTTPSRPLKAACDQFEHLKKSFLHRSAAIRGSVKLLLLVILFSLPWLIENTSGMEYAMLYLLADNGKKSGRADGNVYMKNGVVRGFSVPALVQNGYTQAQRASLSALSSAWNALTQAQMIAWNSATGFTSVDRFGRTFTLKGKDLFVTLNQNLFNAGGTPLNDVPIPAAIPGITALTVTAAAGLGTVSLAFTPTPTEANITHLVFATAAMSAGTFKPSLSAYRLIRAMSGAQASPFAAGTFYTIKWGAMIAASKIFIKMIPINDDTGQAGAAIVASDIVAA